MQFNVPFLYVCLAQNWHWICANSVLQYPISLTYPGSTIQFFNFDFYHSNRRTQRDHFLKWELYTSSWDGFRATKHVAKESCFLNRTLIPCSLNIMEIINLHHDYKWYSKLIVSESICVNDSVLFLYGDIYSLCVHTLNPPPDLCLIMHHFTIVLIHV